MTETSDFMTDYVEGRYCCFCFNLQPSSHHIIILHHDQKESSRALRSLILAACHMIMRMREQTYPGT